MSELEEACVHVPQRVVDSRWDLAGWLAAGFVSVSSEVAVMRQCSGTAGKRAHELLPADTVQYWQSEVTGQWMRCGMWMPGSARP